MIQPFDLVVFCTITALTLSIALVQRGRAGEVPAVVDHPVRLRRDRMLKADARSGAPSGSPLAAFDRGLERTLIRAGIQMDGPIYVAIVASGALVLGAIAWAFGQPILVQGVCCLAGLGLGLSGSYVAMRTRLNKFDKQFPIALELLARATRAGENLENAFRIAAESSSEPIRDEFLQCVRQLQLGLPVDAVTEDLAWRIDSVDVHLLSHAISIHQSLGGRLADALEKLSTVIRNRTECEQKIKSMTSIGRFSVIAIVLMGLFVLVYMLTAEPDYIDNLFTSNLGQKLLAYACVSELIGLIWVGITLKSTL